MPAGGLKTMKYNYFLADLVKRMDAIKVKSSLEGTENRTEDSIITNLPLFIVKIAPEMPLTNIAMTVISLPVVLACYKITGNTIWWTYPEKPRAAAKNYNTF